MRNKNKIKMFSLLTSFALVFCLMIPTGFAAYAATKPGSLQAGNFVMQETSTGINYNAATSTYPINNGEYMTLYPTAYNFTTSSGGAHDCTGSIVFSCGGVSVYHGFTEYPGGQPTTQYSGFLRVLYASPTQINVIMDYWSATANYHSITQYDNGGNVRQQSYLTMPCVYGC